MFAAFGRQRPHARHRMLLTQPHTSKGRGFADAIVFAQPTHKTHCTTTCSPHPGARKESGTTTMSGIKNAPACYRAPRCPDPEFPPKIPKNYPPPAEILEPQKKPKNTEKIPKTGIFGYFFGIFLVFSGHLGVNSASLEFHPAGYFFGILVEIPGRAISGLCSRSGRSQVWNRKRVGIPVSPYRIQHPPSPTIMEKYSKITSWPTPGPSWKLLKSYQKDYTFSNFFCNWSVSFRTVRGWAKL